MKDSVNIEFVENGLILKASKEIKDAKGMAQWNDETYIFQDMEELTSWLEEHKKDKSIKIKDKNKIMRTLEEISHD